jgi:hypothetical protein
MPNREVNVIDVESKLDLSPPGRCFFDGKPLKPKRICYEFSMYGRRWRVPSVWARVCEKGHTFFAPEVSNVIDKQVFEIAYPKESKLGKLLDES